MKFTIRTDEFQKGLSIAYKPLSKSNFITPAYSAYLLEVDEDGLTITGSNGDLSIATLIPFFKNNQEIIRDAVKGAILVKAQTLKNIIDHIVESEVTFQVLVDKVVQISTKTSQFTMNSMSADEYPEKDFSLIGTCVRIGSKEFVESVAQVVFCVSTKLTSMNRQALTGINLESDTVNLTFTGTDGARLGKTTISALSNERFNITVPAKAMTDVATTITTEREIEIFVSLKRVCFNLENTIIVSSLIEGSYPATNNIIPKNFNYVLEVNAQEFLSILNRVTSISGEPDAPVQLEMDPWKVIVSSKVVSQDAAAPSAKEELTNFKYSGEKLKMSFNSGYVKDAIKALKAKEVTLNFVGEMKPFTVANKDDSSVIQLITPLRSF